jgi:hypothetical protein
LPRRPKKSPNMAAEPDWPPFFLGLAAAALPTSPALLASSS